MKKLSLILSSIFLTTACACSALPSPSSEPSNAPAPSISPTPGLADRIAEYKRVTHYIDYSDETGKIINNKIKNMNVWSLDVWFEDTPFVENIQFMQATGGCDWRDLFVDPYDRTVPDDYRFDNLINACKKTLRQGIKPFIKTGNVPIKYSSAYKYGDFGVNVLPPDDWNVYYNYIHAIAEALVNEFGLEEVSSWTWGVYTEYENPSWFDAGTPEQTAVEFCKLYDYTVAALTDVLGNNIEIGAHSMSCSEGKWDEAIFLAHCANGTNYATGETGTRITYTAISYYDKTPNDINENGLADTVRNIRNILNGLGLNIPIGVDEGRILYGENGKNAADLTSRIVGQTYQAAYDARTYDIMIENDIDYFSAWSYISFGGLPTVSLHTANLFFKMVGSAQLGVNTVLGNEDYILGENKAFAGYDKETGGINIMAYNFIPDLYAEDSGNKVFYSGDTVFSVKLPDNVKKAKITLTPVDNDCNFFDEWLDDMKKYNISSEHFNWSPDSTSESNVIDPEAKAILNSQLGRYSKCAELHPTEYIADVIDGICTVTTHLPINTVMFCSIEPVT